MRYDAFCTGIFTKRKRAKEEKKGGVEKIGLPQRAELVLYQGGVPKLREKQIIVMGNAQEGSYSHYLEILIIGIA